MKFYAQLNENKICTGVSQLSGEVKQPHMIEIPSADVSYMWKKYENGQWSEETFEPQTTVALTEFEQLKKNIQATQTAVDFLLMGGM